MPRSTASSTANALTPSRKVKNEMHETKVDVKDAPEFPMFCYQCEQTAQGKGCTQMGVCGKNPEVAALQDLLVYALHGLSIVAVHGRNTRIYEREIHRFVCEAAFSTLTNVNFNPERFVPLIKRTVEYRDRLNKLVRANLPEDMAAFQPSDEVVELVKLGEKVGIKAESDVGGDVHSLRW